MDDNKPLNAKLIDQKFMEWGQNSEQKAENGDLAFLATIVHDLIMDVNKLHKALDQGES